MLKKIISVCFSILLVLSLLSGCENGSGNGNSSDTAGNSGNNGVSTGNTAASNRDSTPDDGKISIVTTIFPEYDWVMSILGDNKDVANVTLLTDDGVDLHSYQPTAEDMVIISDCDLLIYVGGESEKWIDDVQKQSAKNNMISVNLLKTLGDSAKAEEFAEGMQISDAEDSHHSDHLKNDADTNVNAGADRHTHEDNSQGHSVEEHSVELDEHVWLSLRNAEIFCKKIAAVLGELDPVNKDLYAANAAEYIEALSALDAEYQAAISSSSGKTLIFCDRFPFRYLVDDYNIQYYAAFAGCSAESEASFETVAFLANKLDELNLKTVITIDGSRLNLADAVIQNTAKKNQEVLIMDSMQAVTSEDIANGYTYLSAMEQNLNVLKTALN